MLKAFFGKKLNQTQVFDDMGTKVTVTEISVEPAVVVQLKTLKIDGYWALQLGFDHKQTKNITKPLMGHLKKTGQGKFLPRFLREVRLDESKITADQVPFKIGDKVNCDTFIAVGDKVKITGISKGKGFQGGVKRHNFAGGPRTHGQSDRERAPGSIGQTTTPGRVYKGKRMAGRMGNDQVTISGLRVISLDNEKQILKVKGLIPGRKNSLVKIQKN